ncbi:hypothetical protein PsorP6_017139 [Peronosclerospora sorghi]|uniref:Uncharacterized protein n=1 Tax=Peronosclerospora sorghi TaxID=230839 RepID=A0ACC0WFQ8_9STRA|nr:hypothetical protein PsorP6_017139 [Peronosclerospora sorghi]
MSFAMFPAPSSEDIQLDTQLYTMIELEHSRYRSFFAKLVGEDGPFISREAALEFFVKSSLSAEQVQELYAQIKTLALVQDFKAMSETEFVMAMHLIMCLTKRNLVKLPPKFPTYLFPTLDLTPATVPRQVSHDPPSLLPLPSSNVSLMTSSMTSKTSLRDAKSLCDLVTTELRTKEHEAKLLLKVDQSQTRALQNLEACVERVADQVDQLGFPVPSSSRSLEALDGFKTLLQKHVLAVKQEIQSLQLAAQMHSVVAEVGQDAGNEPLQVASDLTQELEALQRQTVQLMTRKVDLVERLVAIKAGDLAAMEQSSRSLFTDVKNPAFAVSKGALTVGELNSTPPPNSSDPALVHEASSGNWATFGLLPSQDAPPSQQTSARDPFGLNASPTAATTSDGIKATASAPETDFIWGQ